MHTKRQTWEPTSSQTVGFFWWICFNSSFQPKIPISPDGNHQRTEIQKALDKYSNIFKVTFLALKYFMWEIHVVGLAFWTPN